MKDEPRGIIMLSLMIGLLILCGVVLSSVLWSYWNKPVLGLHHGHLMACPDSPNCVCSEALTPASHQISPLQLAPDESEKDAWKRLQQLLKNNGGDIDAQTLSDFYLHARLTTPWLHYVDDVEARMDFQNRLIHLRSASRVGYSDLGANRRRMEALQQQWMQH